ncbi:MAG: NUDIX hydrolase [Nanoarchaeota archaeon]|nr:NUDIX hydrolase [Nanoarchaeota archaeon]MBU1270364.1 NUDIX hydrolase [Nanoarchaeota archaeon]MBU1604679.1 NUDIX hydrolase [Nanoarchaeota archaeon]MBU2443361.1 NUDIX hydrolase [Nanoarchaeota archaeon]
MTDKKGVQAIVCDSQGQSFFLILRRVEEWRGWEFPKTLLKEGESEDEAVERLIKNQVGISKHSVVKKMDFTKIVKNGDDEHNFQFYFINASMNIPVRNYNADKKHDYYLWALGSDVKTKLTWEPDKEALNEAIKIIN